MSASAAPLILELGSQSARTPNNTLMMVGCAILLATVGILAGAVSVGGRLRRSEGNRKCLLSYLCFATGWSLYLALATLLRLLGHPILGTVVALIVFAGFGLAAVALAILGLSELRRSPDVIKDGRGTALTSLSLCGLVVALMVGAFSLGILQGLRSGRKSLAPPGATAVVQEWGFSIQPPAPWTRVDAGPVNPLAAVAFDRQGPEGLLMVLAERLPAGSYPEYEDVTSVIRDNLAKAGTGKVQTLDEAAETLNGLQGYRLICEATIEGSRLRYFYWLHLAPGIVFQLVAISATEDAPLIISEARKAFASFTLVQPK